ncbi:hypothetical protein FI667_g2765, partial [Globisporangium splendens]
MASDDAFGGDFTFGSSSSSSLDGLPAFFTNGSVDDKKYESLLADLRAHDLLGPLDGDSSDAFGASSSSGSGSSSLFFNDAFSAVFMGTFSESKSLFSDNTTTATSGSNASKPPPGFARAPPGLVAPSETDLKWARGQQEFSRIEEKFHSGTTTTASANFLASPARGDDAELTFDESQFLNLRSLGLDDDDAMGSPVNKTKAAQPSPPGLSPKKAPQTPQQLPPLPSALPVPPAPPAGFQPNAPTPSGATPPSPLPGAWNNNVHHPQQQMQPPRPMGMPPHMHGAPPSHMHPPPPPPFMHHGPPHGMPYPPPPPHFAGGHPQFPPRGAPMPPPRPNFKMMTPRDINFVVQQQMKQIRSSDPFSDDYYFHNYVQKRTRAVANSGMGPRPPALPLPSWKLQHVKSVDPRDAQREASSRNWETSFQVLGRNSKGSLYRPKQMLALASSNADAQDKKDGDSPTASAAGDSENGHAKSADEAAPKVLKMDSEAGQNSVFSNETWQKRLEIDRGMQCLLSLQDARHILDARGINVQQFHSMDEKDIDPSLAELRTRTTALLLELASLLGVSVSDDESRTPSCNLEQLYKMLYVAKGKKLVSRALPLLHPSARFVLLPHLVEYLLSARNVGRFAGAEAQDEGDERLCQTLVLILMYHPLAPPAELFAESLQRALEGHDMQSLALLLHNRARAEALQALLQRGGTAVQQVESEPTKNQWNHYQAMFVSLATAIKQTA